MSQLAQPFRQGEPIARRDVSNVSLSPTTENKKVTIALMGAGPSFSFQEDLAVGRSFREASFDTSSYESVFSNVEMSSGTMHLRTEPVRRHLRGGSTLAVSVRSELSRLLVLDDRSPATEPFSVNQRATFEGAAGAALAVDEASLRMAEAAEQECEEDLRDELRRERALWKYGRR